MRPVIETRITQHTIWQALTGTTPPLALAAAPIVRAVLDSRDVGSGDLFFALPGQFADGHDYISASLHSGAQAVICEARGQAAAEQQGAIIVDCTKNRSAAAQSVAAQIVQPSGTAVSLAYLVDDSLAALQAIGAFQRLHRAHPNVRVTGITGSVGKSSSKELTAAVLRQRFTTLHSPGSLNNEQGVPFTLLGLGLEHERAVLEMGTYGLGELYNICTWARPHVGVVTNIGPVHLERMGTLERITEAKAELVASLPSGSEGGVAVLNWDDARVRSMASKTSAHLLRYGLTPEADLWADEIESQGMEGIRFRFYYREPGYLGEQRGGIAQSEKVETFYVKVPLLGRHSVHTALVAAAVGLVEGLSWAEIVAGLQRSTNHIRLVVVPGVNGSTLIDDTYNASPASMIAALNLLADLQPTGAGRRVAVLGDMRELGTYTDEGHKLVGRRAADVVDLLITVGELGRSIGEEAVRAGLESHQLFAFDEQKVAIELIVQIVHAEDLVLVKGSRAVGMDDIVARISVSQTNPI